MTGLQYSGTKFPYRVQPHRSMKEEYPSLYYKFKNVKVAKAFRDESKGIGMSKPPLAMIWG